MRIFLLFIVFVMLSTSAIAQDTLKQTTVAAQEAAAKTKAMQMDLDDLQKRLVAASRSERDLNEQMRDIQARTTKLEREQDMVNAELKERRASLAALLVALTRLGRLPPEIGILRQEKTHDAALAAILLKSALPEIRADAARLSKTLASLDAVQKTLARERAALANARADQERERADIESLIASRQQKLKLTAQEQAALNARLEKLRAETTTVTELVDKVASAIGITRKFEDTAPLVLRGGMLQPVSGTLSRRFGDKDASGTESNGLQFQVDGGSRIVSPAKGRVMFAGPFHGYGQIVILEHEGDMHSMISGFGRIDVTVGQKIAQGEPLGLAGDTVYFELRHRGNLIDPRPRAR